MSVRAGCAPADLVNALYGDDIILVNPANPGAAERRRRRNGFFGCSARVPDGRNQRVSCVFALFRGWTPGMAMTSTVIRFDNPFARHPFPDDVLSPDQHFTAPQEAVREA